MNDDDDTHGPDGRADDADSLDADAQMIADVLAEPDVWVELEPGLEDRIVAAISADAAATGAPDTSPATDAVTQLSSRRRPPTSAMRRWGGPIAAGIAAALLVIVGFAAVTRDANDVDVEVAMTATDLAPAARADLGIETTPNGTRLVLDVSGLPPAPEGKVYEAWLRKDAEVGVSAGTFHMRGGAGALELWAGVLIEDYPLVTVTLQDETDPISSGEVVLRALVGQ